ncbi:MAG: hypothetical protein GX975_02420 [Clostridiales bacterium]|nr:hypothetical protein [Clostridiales bacterium]
MRDITTYVATRKNIFVWLAALLSLISTGTRIAYIVQSGRTGFFFLIFGAILPIIANLFIAIRLPLRGERQFYITIVPVVVLVLYLGLTAIGCVDGIFMTTLCVIVSLAFAGIYFLTFSGRINSKFIVTVYFLAVFGALLLDSKTLGLFHFDRRFPEWNFISDISIVLSILCVILSARRLPPPREGESYRLCWGDRLDGRFLRTLDPLFKCMPYFMPGRQVSSNLINDSIEISVTEDFIRRKRKEGFKRFGITHILLAAYVRCIAELPALNRFVSGQKVYNRFNIEICMAVKREMTREAPETIVKMEFLHTDTVEDVYRRFEEAIGAIKNAEDDSDIDTATRLLNLVPGLVFKFIVRFASILDYFGLLPAALLKLSPFHGSMFLTSMGSLGIPPIYHHLYEFGNIPAFCALGHKYTKSELDREGKLVHKKYIDYKWTADERIIDGFYYASVMKRMRSLISRPEQLDRPPKEVVQDIM